MKSSIWAIIACAAIGTTSTACVEMMQSGGLTVMKPDFEDAASTVKARAAFETSCPKDKLEVVALAQQYEAVSQLGVSGCDHHLVYVRVAGSWVLNGGEEKTETARNNNGISK